MNLEQTLKENFEYPGPKGLLEPLVEQLGLRWIDYTLNPTGKYGDEAILGILEDNGRIVRPEGDFVRIRPLVWKLCNGGNLNKEEKEYLSLCYQNLVESIEAVKAGQVLIIPSEFTIIPGNYENSIRFRKWGDIVRLKRFKTKKEANDAKATPRKLYSEAAEKAKLHEFYTGCNFSGIREGEGDIYNRRLLEDNIDSTIMFVYCSSEERLEKEAKIAILQPGFGEPSIGGVFTVRVPSVDKEQVPHYDVLLKSVPIRRGRMVDYATWFNLNSAHYCRIRQESANTTRFKRGMQDLCKHIGAAELFLAKYLKHSGEPYEIAFLTVMIPTESQFAYSMNLRKKVLVELNADGGLRRRSLTKIEREVLQWKRVALRGFAETFDAKKGFERYILAY